MPDAQRGWHPILTAFEPKPGEWWLKTPNGDPYAILTILRRGEEVGYRAVSYAERLEDRRHLGYYRRLFAAAEDVHNRYVRATSAPKRTPQRLSPPPTLPTAPIA
ncbi:hypothetical protein [Amnibacterium flavum]|uniref:hypothetical protein n=1 Tax=Amnibacterium flavum TaxID=2173173 RepID=UPI0010579C3F|nr:hypothetical protein [Amnibacterium flavum]